MFWCHSRMYVPVLLNVQIVKQNISSPGAGFLCVMMNVDPETTVLFVNDVEITETTTAL